jgi:predicted GIY-YIG superfamily endonuclease
VTSIAKTNEKLLLYITMFTLRQAHGDTRGHGELEHQEGLIEGCYTHNKRPVELMHVEEFRDIVEAISMEKQIKGWSRQKKKALIAGNYQKLVELSKSHPSTSSG